MSISDSKSCIYIYIAMAYDQYYFKIKVVLEGLILQSNRAILFVLSPHGIHAIKCES